MRKGLLIYPIKKDAIFNIGDYIQSIAASQFMGHPDELDLLNRESLHSCDGENLKLILNGWFMHNPKNWPPSDVIDPLFVAFHVNKLAEKEMLNSEGVAYLKKHQPIGCRDRYTMEKLQACGVDAYFSGCMTLTLGESFKHRPDQADTVYFTDVNTRCSVSLGFVARCAIAVLFKAVTLRRIKHRMQECNYPVFNKSIVSFYATYSRIFEDEVLEKAEYMQQEIPNTFETEQEKFEYAKGLLAKYERAKFVVSSRIHCALPCLAMETPILFVHNENLDEVHNCRMDGLVELFQKITIRGGNVISDLGKKKIGMNTSFRNKDMFKSLAKSLSERCKAFCQDNV